MIGNETVESSMRVSTTGINCLQNLIVWHTNVFMFVKSLKIISIDSKVAAVEDTGCTSNAQTQTLDPFVHTAHIQYLSLIHI